MSSPNKESQAKSRRRAPKPEWRDEVRALPEIDPAEARARAEGWHALYRPQNDEARRLVDAVVEASLTSDRVWLFEKQMLRQQARDRVAAWDAADEAERTALVGELDRDPAKAVAGLRRTASGCRTLIAIWDGLRGKLGAGEPWTAEDRGECACLRGTTLDRVADDPEAAFWLYNEGDTPGPLDRKGKEKGKGNGKGKGPSRRAGKGARPGAPAGSGSSPTPGPLPSSEEARAWLIRRITGIVAGLKEREEHLRITHEEPEYTRLATPELLLMGREGSRFLRYLTQARVQSDRAMKALDQAISRDAELARQGLPPSGPSFGKNRPSGVGGRDEKQVPRAEG